MENTETNAGKAKIRPNIANMVKTTGGSFHKDDFIGNALAGLTLEQVKTVAVELGLDPAKYAHLNNGQIRMTLGNSLRKLAGAVDANGNLAEDFAINRAKIEGVAAQYREQNAADKEANEQAKADAKAAKAAEATAKKEAAAAKKAAKAEAAAA
jgi:hypothetical protein